MSAIFQIPHIIPNSILRSHEETEAKPLPRLPRGWSRICHETTLLLRTLGLGIIVTTCQGLFSKQFDEPTKTAIVQRRSTALLRSLIHVLPVAFALLEIILNWRGYYLGALFNRQTLLQFVAKAHEVTIQASLSAIILSYLRHQVITNAGHGLPFGALLGGIQFTQISYLWSTELWACILSRQFQVLRKLTFIALILIAGLLAVTSGPSSATLLIPRQNVWPIESLYLLLNATFEDIWPDYLNGDGISEDCSTAILETIHNDRGCPIDDLLPLISGGVILSEAGIDAGDYSYHDIIGDHVTYAKSLLFGSCQSSSEDQYCALATQETLLPGMVNHVMEGIDVGVFSDTLDLRFDLYTSIQHDYYQPYTLGSCKTGSIRATSNQTLIQFPHLSETELELQKPREMFSIPDLTTAQVIEKFGNSSLYRTAWIDLEVFPTKLKI